MTRGLDTTLPLPSASSAEISRFRKRLAVALNSEMREGRRVEVVLAGGRQVDELGVGVVDAAGGLQRLAADGVEVAADGDAVVAADAVAGQAAVHAAQVVGAEAHAERAAEGVVGDRRCAPRSAPGAPGCRSSAISAWISSSFEGMSVTNSWLVRGSAQHAAARRQDARRRGAPMPAPMPARRRRPAGPRRAGGARCRRRARS